MKKLIIAALLTAPVATYAMDALDDTAMGGVAAQDGITINTSIKADIDRIRWTDTTDAFGNGGHLNLNGVHFSSDGTATGSAVSTGDVLIDVAVGNGTTKLDRLTLTSNNMSFGIGIDSIKIGSTSGATASAAGTATEGGSLGSLKILGVNMAGTTQEIWGHAGFNYETASGVNFGNKLAAASATSIAGDGTTGIAMLATMKLDVGDAVAGTGGIVYTDTDANGGSVTLQGVSLRKAGDAASGVRVLNLMDVVTESGTTKLQLKTAMEKADVTIGKVMIGSASAGRLELQGLAIGNQTTKIFAH